MIPEFERGLLVAFLRLNLTDAQKEIMGKFYPELMELCGLSVPMRAGVTLATYNETEGLCREGKYIQAIKFVRQYATDRNVPELKGLKEAKDWVDANFGHLRNVPSQS